MTWLPTNPEPPVTSTVLTASLSDGMRFACLRPSGGPNMAKLARDVMTREPACCSPSTTLDLVAKMMVQNNCGEIPIVDTANRPVGVVTDRDIVCRVVAEGKNPSAYTAETCM